MGQGARAPFCCANGGCYVCRWGIAKDEEFYEGAEQEDDGELAEKETLGEGEPVGGVSALRDLEPAEGRTRILL